MLLQGEWASSSWGSVADRGGLVWGGVEWLLLIIIVITINIVAVTVPSLISFFFFPLNFSYVNPGSLPFVSPLEGGEVAPGFRRSTEVENTKESFVKDAARELLYI